MMYIACVDCLGSITSGEYSTLNFEAMDSSCYGEESTQSVKGTSTNLSSSALLTCSRGR